MLAMSHIHTYRCIHTHNGKYNNICIHNYLINPHKRENNV